VGIEKVGGLPINTPNIVTTRHTRPDAHYTAPERCNRQGGNCLPITNQNTSNQPAGANSSRPEMLNNTK